VELIGLFVDEDNHSYSTISPTTIRIAAPRPWEGSWQNDTHHPFLILAIRLDRGQIFPFTYLVDVDENILVRFETVMDNRIVIEVDEDA
jgi:hypothetical protein